MTRLFIMRKSTMNKMTAQMNCYLNNEFLCALKNGEDASCRVDSGIVEFKCAIPGCPPSDPIFLELKENALVTITLRQTGWKPEISVHDPSIVLDKDIVNVRSCETRFCPTKTVEGYLALDENSRLWALYKGLIPSWKNDIPRRFDSIIGYELLEDGSSITKGGIGHAVVGGLLFGRTGAVVGGITGTRKTKQTCTNLTIKITVDSVSCPTEYISLITSSTKRESAVYKKAYKIAQDILSLLQVICSQVEQERREPPKPQPEPQQTPPPREAPAPGGSVFDELRRYKTLADEGIITEEEFLAKKKQLLGL